MIEFGNTLRAARESKGYSIGQVAEATHLAPSMVEELEREDFSHIAAPIYGRGFVKLYCEAVGLAPKPLVDEFMEIYNGNRDTPIKERPAEQPPVAATQPEAPQEETPQAEDAWRQEEADEPAPEPTTPDEDDLFAAVSQQSASQGLSRYAAPVGQTRAYAASLPSAAAWRIAALACISAAILALLAFGARALYKATKATPADVEENTSAPATAEAPRQSASKPATAAEPRTQQEIPALYID